MLKPAPAVEFEKVSQSPVAQVHFPLSWKMSREDSQSISLSTSPAHSSKFRSEPKTFCSSSGMQNLSSATSHAVTTLTVIPACVSTVFTSGSQTVRQYSSLPSLNDTIWGISLGFPAMPEEVSERFAIDFFCRSWKP